MNRIKPEEQRLLQEKFRLTRQKNRQVNEMLRINGIPVNDDQPYYMQPAALMAGFGRLPNEDDLEAAERSLERMIQLREQNRKTLKKLNQNENDRLRYYAREMGEPANHDNQNLTRLTANLVRKQNRNNRRPALLQSDVSDSSGDERQNNQRQRPIARRRVRAGHRQNPNNAERRQQYRQNQGDIEQGIPGQNQRERAPIPLRARATIINPRVAPSAFSR